MLARAVVLVGKDTRPHMGEVATQSSGEGTVRVRPVPHHDRPRQVDPGKHSMHERDHRRMGLTRHHGPDTRRPLHGGEQGTAAGNLAGRRGIGGVGVRTDESCPAPNGGRSPGQHGVVETAMKTHHHGVDPHDRIRVGGEHARTPCRHLLGQAPTPDHHHAFLGTNQQRRGPSGCEDPPAAGNADLLQHGLQFSRRTEGTVRDEQDRDAGGQETTQRLHRPRNGSLAQPHNTVEIAQHRSGSPKFVHRHPSCHPVGVPTFDAFRALRYATPGSTDLLALTSPPYDVFDAQERARFAVEDRNIVHIDYPVESEGPDRYERAGRLLRDWFERGILVEDDAPTLTIYRMTFTDGAGRTRRTVGVVGALEVVDEGAPGVLPHEQTTPKAKTDRLDLTRATMSNLSPVWGLSLARGLTAMLAEPGSETGRLTDEDGVLHVVERLDDPERIAAISALVSSSPVLIADGHHRYAISRTYRDEVRSQGGTRGAETTMTLVQELEEEQLAIAAIHRLYEESTEDLIPLLRPFYETEADGAAGPGLVAEMERRGALVLLDADCRVTWLVPRADAFEGVRDIDSLRLETALAPRPMKVRYQHGLTRVLEALERGEAASAILIRPVPLAEIEITARTGALMPPKSTFFTPKPRTGLVLRRLDP